MTVAQVFVDTSAWLALFNRNDTYHGDAVAAHRDLAEARRVTSWGIVAETYTWLRYHIGYQAGDRWLREAAALEERGVLHVIYPNPGSEASVRRALARFADQDLSYVDAFTLVTVEFHSRIDAIFAFDHHLALAGLPMVPGLAP